MPFWLLVVILVTLIVLCWGGAYGMYKPPPASPVVSGLLGILGLILFIVLVVVFMGYLGASNTVTYR